MCRRRQADDQQSRGRIAESRHRPAPILLFSIRASSNARDFLTMHHEARTADAFDDLLVQDSKRTYVLRKEGWHREPGSVCAALGVKWERIILVVIINR